MAISSSVTLLFWFGRAIPTLSEILIGPQKRCNKKIRWKLVIVSPILSSCPINVSTILSSCLTNVSPILSPCLTNVSSMSVQCLNRNVNGIINCHNIILNSISSININSCIEKFSKFVFFFVFGFPT